MAAHRRSYRWAGLLISAAGLLIAGLVPASHVQAADSPTETTSTIGTFRWWDGSSYYYSFGTAQNRRTATYGQTITPSADVGLEKFTFIVQLEPTVRMRGYVYEWNPAPLELRAVGEPVWSGDRYVVPATIPGSGSRSSRTACRWMRASTTSLSVHVRPAATARD